MQINWLHQIAKVKPNAVFQLYVRLFEFLNFLLYFDFSTSPWASILAIMPTEDVVWFVACSKIQTTFEIHHV